MSKEQTPKPNTTITIRRRIIITVAVMVLGGFGLLGYNLGCLQLRDYEELQAKASKQQMRATTIPANRGVIYDANMTVLAQSTTVWNISVSPKEIPDEKKEAVAKGLSEILEVDYDALLERMRTSNSYYESVKKKVEKPATDAVREWVSSADLPGVNIDQDTKRYYPYGDFASTVLGFTSSDNKGLAGLEYYYNDTLSGTPGRSVQATNALGYEMPYAEESYYEAKDGNSLVSTLDEVIQHSLEKNLQLAVKTHNVSQRAIGIVMDVNTGAILGMATEGAYDPNDPFTIYDEALRAQVDAVQDDPATADVNEHTEALEKARQFQWRNKAVNDLYEPGSVFKTVTAAAALDSGSSTINSSFSCSGSLTVAGTRMRCAHPEGHGSQTLLQSYVNSCNPAFIQIGTKMGAETFFSYFESFGLTQKTGIDLPGEAQSQFYKAESLGPVQLASSSFGQSIKITPIQMITAVSTAINGGHLVQPHMVSKILDENGNVVKDVTPASKRQVISEETSAQMRTLMAGAAVSKTQVAGYQVGGKSGTSQKLDSGDPEARIASFVAVAPINDPKVAVLIVLDEPHSYSSYGGMLAAPVAGKVLGDVLPYIGIQPVYNEENGEAQVTAGLGDQTGGLLVDVQAALQKQGFFSKVVGNGTTVVRQFPSGGTSLAKGSTVILYTEEGAADSMITVPDIIGRSNTAASQALTAVGLNIFKEGVISDDTNIKALSQNVEPGTQVPAGTVVTVVFGDNTIYD